MKFSLAGPIQYTLGKDWYTYGATAAAAVSFLDKSSLLAWWRLDTDVSASCAEGPDSSGNGHVLTAPTDADRPSLDSGDAPSSRIQTQVVCLTRMMCSSQQTQTLCHLATAQPISHFQSLVGLNLPA